MDETRRLKRASLRLALLIFAVFALLFAGLGVLVHQSVAASLFAVVDEDVLAYRGEASVGVVSKIESPGVLDGAENLPAIEFEPSFDPRTQTVTVLRDTDGGFAGTAGAYPGLELDFDRLSFDAGLLGEAYLIEQDGRHYRVANFATGGDGDAAFAQVLANVDSEVAILDRLSAVLAAALAAALALSALASYLLSRRALRPVAEAWERQTRFVADASHELRTPLAVIRANLELLLDEPRAPVIERFPCVNVSIEEVERLSRLTDELLELTASDAGSLGLSFERLDVAEVAEGMATAYRDLAEAQGKRLSFDSDGAVEASADPDRLRQLMAILLDNALKYTEAGDEVSVEVRAQGHRAVIRVSDTGVGIGDENLARAFDRFYRADGARSRKAGGHGLGLPIAKGIVEAHGGAVRMERNRPKGVVVAAVLPRRFPKDR